MHTLSRWSHHNACKAVVFSLVVFAMLFGQTGLAGATSVGIVTPTPTSAGPAATQETATQPPAATETPTVTETPPAETATAVPTDLPTEATPTEITPTPAPTATRPPANDDEAIRMGVQAAISANQEASLAFMLYTVRVERIQYTSDRLTALAWLAFADPQTGENIATEPGLAIAKRGSRGWQITMQVDAKWDDAVHQVPDKLLSPTLKAEYRSGATAQAVVQSGTVYTGYKLPWKGGTLNTITGSIGHVLTYKSCPNDCLYAFDFADGTMFPIYASKAGRVKYAVDSFANGNTTNANYLVLEDASTVPTTYQVYWHLAQNSIPPALRVKGTTVNQGQFIGLADDTGASTGHHLHFHVHANPYSAWGTSVDIVFDEVLQNGGRPRTCSEAAAFPQYGSECSPNNKLLSGNSTGPTPPAPSISAPSGTVNTATPALKWSAVDGGLQYYLWVNKVGSATATLSQLVNASACSSGVCSYTPPILTDGSYQFKVRAGSATGWSDFSAAQSFAINTKPLVPVLVSPSGDIQVNNPAYTWKAVPGATQYYLIVYSVASASNIIYRSLSAANVCSGDTCAYVSTALLKHGSYRFEVRSGSASGVWSAYSAWMPFFAYLAPQPPLLVAPALNEKVTVQRVKYQWQGVPGASKYNLRIYNGAGTLLYNYELASIYMCTADVCWFRPAINLAAGKYQFKMRAYNAYGYGSFSALQPFTVQLKPDPPLLVSPSGAINSISPAYTWKAVPGATAYYLMVYSNSEVKYIIYRTLYPANVCSGDTCAYTSTANVVPGRSYWFWVQAYNSFGWGALSPQMNFNVVQ